MFSENGSKTPQQLPAILGQFDPHPLLAANNKYTDDYSLHFTKIMPACSLNSHSLGIRGRDATTVLHSKTALKSVVDLPSMEFHQHDIDRGWNIELMFFTITEHVDQDTQDWHNPENNYKCVFEGQCVFFKQSMQNRGAQRFPCLNNFVCLSPEKCGTLRTLVFQVEDGPEYCHWKWHQCHRCHCQPHSELSKMQWI